MKVTGSIEVCNNTDQKLEFYLESTDISDLPTTNVPVGSTAFCYDTGDVYVFSGSWSAL